MGEGEGGGRGAESFDRKKAWLSMNHLILAGSFHSYIQKRDSDSVERRRVGGGGGGGNAK